MFLSIHLSFLNCVRSCYAFQELSFVYQFVCYFRVYLFRVAKLSRLISRSLARAQLFVDASQLLARKDLSSLAHCLISFLFAEPRYTLLCTPVTCVAGRNRGNPHCRLEFLHPQDNKYAHTDAMADKLAGSNVLASRKILLALVSLASALNKFVEASLPELEDLLPLLHI